MTYNDYWYIFIGAAILCGVMLVISIILFITLKIPKVIGDLSGSTARKAIKNIREQNEASGDKGYKVSAVNEARGKLTDKISSSGSLVQQNRSQMVGVDTSKIAKPVEQVSNETTVLGETAPANETTVLNQTGAGETTVLPQAAPANETTVLPQAAPTNETTVLPSGVVDAQFAVEYEITYIHSNELITMGAMG